MSDALYAMGGLRNVVSAPTTASDSVSGLVSAYQNQDEEGLFNYSLEILKTPFRIGQGCYNVITFLYHADLFLEFIHLIPPRVKEYAPYFGPIIYTIDLFIESYGLYKELELREGLITPFEMPNNQKIEAQKQSLTNLHRTYCVLADEEEAAITSYANQYIALDNRANYIEEQKNEVIQYKLDLLSRRVTEWLAKDIQEKSQGILTKLNNVRTTAEGQEELEKLFNQIDIQSQKILLVHTLGLFSMLCFLGGSFLLLTTAPFYLPSLIFTLGTALYIGRYLAENGTYITKEWEFDWNNCIPGWITYINNAILELMDSSGQAPPEADLN